MDAGQADRIFRAVNHDSRIDHTIERYATRKLKEPSSEHEMDGVIHITPRHEIRGPVMRALEDFLKRGTKDQAAACRKQAETLEKARAALADDEFHHFPSLPAMMASHNPMGGTGSSQANQVLWALQVIAEQWRALAGTYEVAAVNNTFFYCLGRRFKKEGDLPLFSAKEAHNIFVVVVDAMRNESPALLGDIKTDYCPKESSSEIRRLMQSGHNAGG